MRGVEHALQMSTGELDNNLLQKVAAARESLQDVVNHFLP